MITVTGFVLDECGNPSHAKITFQSTATPIALAGGSVIANTTKTISNAVTDGSFSIVLQAGNYNVTINQSVYTTPTNFQIAVPTGTGTYTINQLITTNLTFPYTLPPDLSWSGQLPMDISLTTNGQVAIQGNSGNPILSFMYGGTVYNITPGGLTGVRGMSAITNGASGGTVSGLALGYTPTAVLLTVQMPGSTNENLFATLVGAPTSSGFTYSLSAATETTGYLLHYLILQ